jgi:hypothetical protein
MPPKKSKVAAKPQKTQDELLAELQELRQENKTLKEKNSKAKSKLQGCYLRHLTRNDA